MMVLSSFLTSCYVQILFLHGNVIDDDAYDDADDADNAF